MRSFLVLTLALSACLLGIEARKNWALLIAGSAGYGNYRHQADVCHAYQIMHKAGIPDEQIVVMMYDDIAHNEENPFKGNVINRPNGENVYPGVLKDYTGREVNAKTFLAVLQGDKEGVRNLLGREGKVIDSGPEDYVFVNFADHGAPGILGMPNLPYLKAREVNEALKKMHAKKKYAKLTFYVESCESGSIFEQLLPQDINVYATTAANARESSYACYFDESRRTYLGDVYSVKWMEDTDMADLQTETLDQQFIKVRAETNTSHCQQYGDMSIDKFTLDKFFKNNVQDSARANKSKPLFKHKPSPVTDAVPSEMAMIQQYKKSIEATGFNTEERARLENKLAELQKTMSQTHQLIWDIARTVYSDLPEKVVYDLVMKTHNNIEEWDCYETAVDTLLAFCPGLDITTNDFALRKFYVLVNLCNANHQEPVIRAVEAASMVNPLCHI